MWVIEKENIVKLGDVFKNKLGKEDRVNIEPVQLSLKPGSIPVYSARPFDTPFHLRPAFDRELKDMLEAEILEPMSWKKATGVDDPLQF